MKAYITVDLGYGDAGKGTTVDALARRVGARLVVRYNGGSQAGHNVVDAVSGHHHTFSQFGSATFVPGVRTLLSRFMVVSPLPMEREEEHLRSKGIANAWNRVYVDERALVTTPYHRAINRLRELARGDAVHGSCGMGVGETRIWALALGPQALRVGDLRDPAIVAAKLQALKVYAYMQASELTLDFKRTEVEREHGTLGVNPALIVERMVSWARRVGILNAEQVGALIHDAGTVIFEGAQGALLDEVHGFHPYTTWSDTTTLNARLILEEAEYRHPVTTLGILRVYAVRHGPGPMVTEDQGLTHRFPDPYNPTNAWQRSIRLGWFDVPATRYALSFVGKVDGLVLTHVDQANAMTEWRICHRYDRPVYETVRFNLNPAGGEIGYHDASGWIGETGLSVLLKSAMPVLTPVPGAELVQEIERAVDRPLWMTSEGPSYTSKRYAAKCELK